MRRQQDQSDPLMFKLSLKDQETNFCPWDAIPGVKYSKYSHFHFPPFSMVILPQRGTESKT